MWENRIEQVRKGGLPPLSQQRGQTTLPDLFYCLVLLFCLGFLTQALDLILDRGGVFHLRSLL